MSAVLVAGIALASASPAGAQEIGEWQFGGRSGTEMDLWGMSDPTPPVSAAQFEHYMDVLGMDEGQRGLARELHGAFRDVYLQDWLVMAETNADSRSEAMFMQHWQTMQAAQGERSAQWREKTTRMTEGLLADIRLLLSEDQEARWALLERDRRRERILPKLATSGPQAVDLVALVGALDLSEAEHAELQPMLDHYATELDDALLPYSKKAESLDKRCDKLEEEQMTAATAWSGEEPNMEKAMELQQRYQELQGDVVSQALDLRKDADRVLEVSRRHTRILLDAVPSHARDAFLDATEKPAESRDVFSATMYSRFKQSVAALENIDATREAYASQMEAMGMGARFAGALEIMRAVEPLTQSQQSEIETITEAYEAEIEQLDREAARAAGRSSDDDGETRQMTVPTVRGVITLYKIGENGWGDYYVNMPGSGDNEDEETRKRRVEIEQRAIDQLRQILTFYQRALIAQS